MTPPRGPSTLAILVGTWQHHQASACGAALLFALASVLAGGSGRVVERLTTLEPAAYAAPSADGAAPPPLSASAVTPGRFGAPEAQSGRSLPHVVDRAYEEPPGATAGCDRWPLGWDGRMTPPWIPGGTCEVATTSFGRGGSATAEPRQTGAPNEQRTFGK
jgi:hypothetical protein